MSASRTMSSARVEPTRMRSTFSAISASRKARQAFFDTVGFSSAKLITFDAVLAVQPGDLLGELHRIAMAPARPEAALAAIVAQMRAAARELHDDGAQAAPIAVARVVDQLPADAVGVEVADHRRGRRRARAAARRERRCPATSPSGVPLASARHQPPRGLLALAAHDRRRPAAPRRGLAPVIGREDAAIDDAQRRGSAAAMRARDLGDRPDGRRSSRNGRTARRRARSARACADDARRSASGRTRRRSGGPRGRRRSAARRSTSRPSGGRWSSRNAAADRGMRHVDQEDAHAASPRWSLCTAKLADNIGFSCIAKYTQMQS